MRSLLIVLHESETSSSFVLSVASDERIVGDVRGFVIAGEFCFLKDRDHFSDHVGHLWQLLSLSPLQFNCKILRYLSA